jgi:hypothetical protein
VERRNEIEHFAIIVIPATYSAFHVHKQLDSSYSLQGTMTSKHLLLELKDTFVCWQLACDSHRQPKYVWFKRSIKSNCEEVKQIRSDKTITALFISRMQNFSMEIKEVTTAVI